MGTGWPHDELPIPLLISLTIMAVSIIPPVYSISVSTGNSGLYGTIHKSSIMTIVTGTSKVAAECEDLSDMFNR